MASLRNSSNKLFAYNSPSDAVAAATLSDLNVWFKEAGYQEVFNNRSLHSSSLADMLALAEYTSTPGYHVVTLIDASILKWGGGDTIFPIKNHWIVWTGMPLVKSTNQPVTSSTNRQKIITLELFSWGNVEPQLKNTTTLDKFLSHLFGGMVFKL